MILTDICGLIKYPREYSSSRYFKWLENNLALEYRDRLAAKDCYALRCSYLHEGTDEISHQRIKELLDYIVFIPSGSNLIRLSNCNFGSSRYDNKKILLLSVTDFCNDLVSAVELWLKKTDKIIPEMLKIENEFRIGNSISIS